MIILRRARKKKRLEVDATSIENYILKLGFILSEKICLLLTILLLLFIIRISQKINKGCVSLEKLGNESMIYVLLLFLLGFIFIKSSTLLVASNDGDFSKKWYDAVAYGIIFSGLTCIAYLLFNSYVYIYIFPVVGMVILPFVSPFVLQYLRSKPFFHRHILRPEVSAWDYIFSSRKSYWVILHLKDGRNIGGVYSSNSFTSAFPYKQDIYLEEVWRLDEDKNFIGKVERSAGIWIVADEISSIEFFVYEEECSDG